MKANLLCLGKLSKRLKDRVIGVSSENGIFTIGRNQDAGYVIRDQNVSRRHVSISYNSNSGWNVKDNSVSFFNDFVFQFTRNA